MELCRAHAKYSCASLCCRGREVFYWELEHRCAHSCPACPCELCCCLAALLVPVGCSSERHIAMRARHTHVRIMFTLRAPDNHLANVLLRTGGWSGSAHSWCQETSSCSQPDTTLTCVTVYACSFVICTAHYYLCMHARDLAFVRCVVALFLMHGQLTTAHMPH